MQEEPIEFDKEESGTISYVIPSNKHGTPDKEEPNNAFCFAALADKHNRSLYTDVPGTLSARTLKALF